MNKFQVGDKVQLVLKAAIDMDNNTSFGDPLNAVYVVNKEADNKTGLGHVKDYILQGVDDKNGTLVGIKEEDLIPAGDNPRHIERVKVERPTKDEYYLAIAEQVSKRSTCLRRQYGAVIVRDDVIVSTGYNGSPRGEKNCCDKGYCVRQLMNMAHNSGSYDECHSAHAEQNAIINAARQGSSVLGGTLYLYGYDYVEKKTIDAEPCPICSRMLKNAGLARIVKNEASKNEETVEDKKTAILEEVAKALDGAATLSDLGKLYEDGMTAAKLMCVAYDHFKQCDTPEEDSDEDVEDLLDVAAQEITEEYGYTTYPMDVGPYYKKGMSKDALIKAYVKGEGLD